MAFDCSAASLGSYHVEHATVDSQYEFALSLARDFVKDYTGDYYFFQFDADEYCLILSDDIGTTSTDASIFGGTVYVFQCTPCEDSQTVELAASASDPEITTTVYEIQGSLSSARYDWSFTSFSIDGCHIYNGEYIYYSSVGVHGARLSEGVTYYAYSFAFLGLVVCMCCLFLGVTVWLYRRR